MNGILSWVAVAIGAVVTFLSWLLGMKNRKIKAQEEKIEGLKEDVGRIEKTAEVQVMVKTEEAKQSIASSEIKKEKSERIEQAVKAENHTDFYNNLIGEWNDEED